MVKEAMNKLHENLSIQFFEFWYQVGLKNMDMIMSNVEPFVMKFNEMLQSLITLTTIERGELANHPAVTLMQERRAQVTEATLHLLKLTMGVEGGNWTVFETIERELWDELKNRTNNFNDTPTIHHIFEMHGGYEFTLNAFYKFGHGIIKYMQLEEKLLEIMKMYTIDRPIHVNGQDYYRDHKNQDDHYEMDRPRPSAHRPENYGHKKDDHKDMMDKFPMEMVMGMMSSFDFEDVEGTIEAVADMAVDVMGMFM